jgi:hypothetical protein
MALFGLLALHSWTLMRDLGKGRKFSEKPLNFSVYPNLRQSHSSSPCLILAP